MAYNYSPEYLGRNQTMVQKLIRVAQSGEVIKATFDTWQEMNAHRAYVSGLLANIARNMQGWSDIRQQVRTWSSMEQDRYCLFVGRPNHVIVGRKPGSSSEKWANSYVRSDLISVASGGGEYVHPNSWEFIPEQDTKIMGAVMNLPPAVTRASFHSTDLDKAGSKEEIKEYFDGLFSPYGWKVVDVTANDFIKLERT